MTQLPDHHARSVAATCFDRNVVVIAGAGSGKTTLLIERLLNLLLGEGLPLGSIVALTFTEKAAAEMRARLAAQLSRVLQILPSGERGRDPASWSLDRVLAQGIAPAVVRERALAALHELDGASIGTIHAFCADLLRRHPAAARLDPAFVVDDGAMTARVLDDEWVAFQARTLNDDAPEAARWRLVLASFDPGIVRAAAAALLELGGAPPVVSEASAARLLAQAAALESRCEKAEALADNPRAKQWCALLGARLRVLAKGGIAALRSREEESPTEWPTQSVPAPGKKCADPAFVTAAMEEAHALTESLLAVDDEMCAAVLELGHRLAAKTRARLDAEGIVSFSQLLVRARDVLAGDPDARRAVQSRIRALLLDEFQDTDPLQYEIAFLLAEDPARPVGPGGDAWDAHLLPGRLFVVGDPKQSIYRFRGADMAACDRALRRLAAQGAVELSLTSNFRSRPQVLGPVNDLCGTLIVEESPYQPKYERLEASRDAGEDASGRVQLWSIRGFTGNADERREAEGRAIGSQVRAWREAGEIKDYGQVVVLLRAMTAGEPYQRGLAEFGVPFVTQGGKGFFQREEVVHAIALLRCLAWPHDGASILAVLRSPSCGASDAEILRFARMTRGEWTLRAASRLTDDERAQAPLVSRALDGLNALAQRVALMPADAAVRAALGQAGLDGGDAAWHPALLPLHAASRSGAQRVANLEKLIERAESLARAEGLSLPRVVERLSAELEKGGKHGESPLADEAVDAVRIMSIHQAKGLEFDIVIVPDVARQPGGGGQRELSITVRDGVLGVELPNGTTNASWPLLSQEDEKHDAAESRRLAYVALTRAKERLVVVNGESRPKSNQQPLQDIMRGWKHEPVRDDGGASLHEGVAHRAFAAPVPLEDPGEAPAPAEELGAAVLAQDEAAAAMSSARRARVRSATGLKEEREAEAAARPYATAEAGVSQSSESPREASLRAERDDAPVPAQADRSSARVIGIAVHLALEEGALEDAGALATLARRAATLAAAEAGVDPGKAAGDVESLLRSLAAPDSEIARELRGATVLARELPFLLAAHDGADWQGFIDLVIERDGQTWVVDWKTDRTLDPERHRAQVALYAEAVRRWRGLVAPPRCALAYVALGRWVEV